MSVELRLPGVLERLPRTTVLGVYCGREIAVGSAGTPGSRAKVSSGCVMLVRSRKIAYRYVVTGFGCSVDHYGLFLILDDKHLILCYNINCYL